MSDIGETGGTRRGFTRSFAALQEIFTFTAAFYDREKIASEDRFAVDFAVEEIFTNVVKYHAASEKEVFVTLERLDDKVQVSIVDPDGDAFDPTKAPDAKTDARLEERTPGGLGIHLTRRLVDSMEFTRNARTSTIMLTKKLR